MSSPTHAVSRCARPARGRTRPASIYQGDTWNGDAATSRSTKSTRTGTNFSTGTSSIGCAGWAEKSGGSMSFCSIRRRSRNPGNPGIFRAQKDYEAAGRRGLAALAGGRCPFCLHQRRRLVPGTIPRLCGPAHRGGPQAHPPAPLRTPAARFPRLPFRTGLLENRLAEDWVTAEGLGVRSAECGMADGKRKGRVREH